MTPHDQPARSAIDVAQGSFGNDDIIKTVIHGATSRNIKPRQDSGLRINRQY
jgi:hypothetical protein